ncbi:STAS domain-containing protein [Priestia endophytica]|uniref:RsbT co-antagonist protein RsbR n=1 Tax=Priestia endophytica DSM 13796 TaxID=1121089 RepID=A0A1I6BXK3_9BACI|nr:STAS domain-containing protein [Priestia endophytica]KYG32928.1 anti-anti-sigma factor [Priestia endophytica]SFQ85617.1 rsbT co-antagonist protein RsbR [Priestia endophytica DSM 13796]
MREMTEKLHDFLLQHIDEMSQEWLDSREVEENSIYTADASSETTEYLREQNQYFTRTIVKVLTGKSLETLSDWAQKVAKGRAQRGEPLYQSIKHFKKFRLIFLKQIESFFYLHPSSITYEDLFLWNKLVNEAFDQTIELFTVYYEQVSDAQSHAQQMLISELSTPVISISDTVGVLPLIGQINDYKNSNFAEKVLLQAKELNLSCLIIDLSGVSSIDTMMTNDLFQVIKMLDLLGIETTITGIRPEISLTAVQLGIDMSRLRTYGKLKDAIDKLLH